MILSRQKELLSPFTEGFDTKDLQEAKALLEELHQRRQSSPNRLLKNPAFTLRQAQGERVGC
jgi:hypothetical protein